MPTHLSAVVHAAFWVKVEIRGPDDCWFFVGDHLPRGYGMLWFRALRTDRQELAHRVAWQLVYGPIACGLFVLHRCDYPPCVNPGHLFLGTHAENMADMRAKGRSQTGDRNVARRYPERMVRGDKHPNRLRPERMARGERSGLTTLTNAQVDEIRRRARPATTGANSHPDCHSALAREFGVTPGTISNIVHRKTWKHLP